MKIIIEIDETKEDDSYQAYSIAYNHNHIIIYDSKKRLLIDGIFSKHTVEFDKDEQPLKTVFELSDILEVKHCPKPVDVTVELKRSLNND